MKKNLKALGLLVCSSLIFIFGCSVNVEKKVEKEKTENEVVQNSNEKENIKKQPEEVVNKNHDGAATGGNNGELGNNKDDTDNEGSGVGHENNSEKLPDIQNPEENIPESEPDENGTGGTTSGDSQENKPGEGESVNPDSGDSDSKDDVDKPVEPEPPEGGEVPHKPEIDTGGNEHGTLPETSKYKPEPENIKDERIVKLNRTNINNKENPKKIYLMVRFLGSSSSGFWRKDFGDKGFAYPREFSLYYDDVGKGVSLNFVNLDPDKQILVGYDLDCGFSDWGGNKFYTNFYYSDNDMAVVMDGKNDVTFSYKSFAVVDPNIQGDFMGNPDFVRYPNNKFKITVPMKDFDPNIHKNIAYLTIYFEPDKGNIDNMFPYVVVLDGFEPKN